MPQMKTSNMLDTLYKAKDTNQKNGRYRMEIYREHVQSFSVRLFTPAVQQGRGDADCSCCTWLTSSSSCHIRVQYLSWWWLLQHLQPRLVQDTDTDQGAVVLILAHCCSRQQ